MPVTRSQLNAFLSVGRPVSGGYVVSSPVTSLVDRPCWWDHTEGRWRPKFGSDPSDEVLLVDADCQLAMDAG